MKLWWILFAAFVLVQPGKVVCAQSLLGSELPPTRVMPAEPAPDNAAMAHAPAGHLVLDDYLRHHPKLSRKLHRNPELLSDPNFVRTHPELEQFIGRHPGSREQFEGTSKRQNGSISHLFARFASARISDNRVILPF